MILTETGQ